MTTRRFLPVAAAGVIAAAVCLALAAVLDIPALALVGAVFVLGVLVAREAWLWRGAGWQWLAMMGALAAVVVVAFAAQKLFG